MSQENEYDSEDDDIPELDSVSSSEVRYCVWHCFHALETLNYSRDSVPCASSMFGHN